jgi:hypothetical protein
LLKQQLLIIVNFFADKGKQTSVFRLLPLAAHKQKFAASIFRKYIYYIYIFIFIFATVSNGKRKMEAQVIFPNPFTV